MALEPRTVQCMPALLRHFAQGQLTIPKTAPADCTAIAVQPVVSAKEHLKN